MKAIICLLLVLLVSLCSANEDVLSQADEQFSAAVRVGEVQSRRRLIKVQETITKIQHHVKRARELRKALRAELEKRHRKIAMKLRKQIEEQRKKMLGSHKDRMKKLAAQLAKFREQMMHHRKMEAEFKEKLAAMKARLKKIHGIEIGEDGKFKRMKDKFGSTDGKDNAIVAKAVEKAKARARKRLNKARDRMMKVLQQADSPEMATHRKCIKTALKHMVQVKGHIPHSSDPTDYSDPADAGRHKGHMGKARNHLTQALKASRECHKLHQGPFHQFGEDDEYVDNKGGKGKKKGEETETASMFSDSSDSWEHRRRLTAPTVLAHRKN